MSITDIGANAAQESGGSGANGDYDDEYERFDLDSVDGFGAQHPTTAVRGTAVALRKLYDEDDPDRSDVAVILDDPEVVTSEAALDDSVVVLSDEDTGDDFKVVNLDDDQTNQPADEMIDFAGNTFYGAVGTEFGDLDRIALKRGGGAGRRITSTLDVNGATAAEAEIERNDDGEITEMTLDDGGFPAHNGGLVEYHPEGRDGERPRYARDPQLRPDVEGQEVVIMIQRLADVDPDYDGPAYWATVFANLEAESDVLVERYVEQSDDKSAEDFLTELGDTEFLKLDPTADFEPDTDLMEVTGWLEWTSFDRESQSDVVAVNTARIASDQGNIYVPEGMSVEEATPEDVTVETDPTEDELSSSETITAFGKGAPEVEV